MQMKRAVLGALLGCSEGLVLSNAALRCMPPVMTLSDGAVAPLPTGEATAALATIRSELSATREELAAEKVRVRDMQTACAVAEAKVSQLERELAVFNDAQVELGTWKQDEGVQPASESVKAVSAAFDTIDVDRSGQVGHPSRPLSRLPLTTSLFTTGRNRSDTACGRSTRASCARRSSRWDRSYQRRTSRR